MRYISCVVVLTMIFAAFVGDVWAQEAVPGDSIVVKQSGKLRSAPEGFASVIHRFQREDTLVVQETTEYYYKVSHQGTSGWLFFNEITPFAEYQEEQNRRERERKHLKALAQKREAYEQSLRDKGFGLMLLRMIDSKNSADGVSVSIRVKNVDPDRTMKYLTFTMQPFNPVGDPVRGRTQDESVKQVRAVGPVKLGETGGWTFENVWYAPSASCVELQRVKVEYMDDSSFTYVDDLHEIDEYAAGVNLEGDCAYDS